MFSNWKQRVGMKSASSASETVNGENLDKNTGIGRANLPPPPVVEKR